MVNTWNHILFLDKYCFETTNLKSTLLLKNDTEKKARCPYIRRRAGREVRKRSFNSVIWPHLAPNAVGPLRSRVPRSETTPVCHARGLCSDTKRRAFLRPLTQAWSVPPGQAIGPVPSLVHTEGQERSLREHNGQSLGGYKSRGGHSVVPVVLATVSPLFIVLT